jgi:hypothetical protein
VTFVYISLFTVYYKHGAFLLNECIIEVSHSCDIFSFSSNSCSSGMERALVEQLASLRASRRGHSFSSDDSGNSSFYF